MLWLDEIEFLPLRFVLEAKEEFILPRYKGATLRGGFGYMFKKTVCVSKLNKDCKKCILSPSCVYAYIFESNQLSARINRKIKNSLGYSKACIVGIGEYGQKRYGILEDKHCLVVL